MSAGPGAVAAFAFTFAGPAGRLEALLDLPASPAPASALPLLAAIVCHPHPLYGGTMHNKVVHRMARALAAAGVPALRFQFRGVGLSDGAHDGGRGEAADTAAALDHLAARFPGVPLLAAGYSFGAWVGLGAGARDARVHALAGVGLATSVHDFADLATCTKPKLVVQGERDALGPLADVRAVVARLAEPKRLVVVPGADHFFADALDAVGAAVAGFARETADGGA